MNLTQAMLHEAIELARGSMAGDIKARVTPQWRKVWDEIEADLPELIAPLEEFDLTKDPSALRQAWIRDELRFFKEEHERYQRLDFPDWEIEFCWRYTAKIELLWHYINLLLADDHWPDTRFITRALERGAAHKQKRAA